MKALWFLAQFAIGFGTAALARADPAIPQNVVSLEVPALLSAGVEIDAERYSRDHRYSLLLALGGQWAATGHYTSQSYSTGAELRVWINRFVLRSTREPEPDTRLGVILRGLLGGGSPALGGPFASVRLDVAVNRLLDHQDEFSTAIAEVEPSLNIGYRIVLFDRIELTPTAGMAYASDIGGVPSVVVSAPLFAWHFGGTIGYLF